MLLFGYWIGIRIVYVYFWPPKNFNGTIILCYFFSAPAIVEIVIVITTWFLLKNFECRFQTLNDIWKDLPNGLTAIPGEWTHSELALSLESLRLLHVDLSELLKIFSLGYGPLLIDFFVFGFINILFSFFFMIKINFSLPDVSFTENILRNLIPYVINLQNTICMMSIIVGASHINDTVIINLANI